VADIRDCKEGGEEESVLLGGFCWSFLGVFLGLVRLSSESSSLISWKRLGIERLKTVRGKEKNLKKKQIIKQEGSPRVLVE
jgi:hypothetical protein